MEDYLLSPLRPAEAYSASLHHIAPASTDFLINTTELFNKLSKLLDRGLTTIAAKITGDIKADFQNLGDRIETMENKLDTTVARANQNCVYIHVIQEQFDNALSKIEDLENRSRRYNFRLRGLLESITDVTAAVQDFIKDLIPDIPPHKPWALQERMVPLEMW